MQLLVKMTPTAKPQRRFFHTATVIRNKLYVLGSTDPDNFRTSLQFFSVDVSVPFTTQGLLWNNLTSINTVPSHLSAAAISGGPNNDTLFLFGSMGFYSFDTNNNLWSIPKVTGEIDIRRDSLTAIPYDGKMYLFGGLFNNSTFNDMLILDTISLEFVRTSNDAPIPRRNYGAVLLPNKQILYLGK